MSLTRQRGRSVNRGLAAVQARIAQEAHAALMEEYVVLYRLKQAEAARAPKPGSLCARCHAEKRLISGGAS